jgi:PBSX family phage portal protein
VKRNILVSTFVSHPLLSRQEFSKWSFDFMVFGNGYLERVNNAFGKPAQLRSSLARFTRCVKDGGHVFAQGYGEPHKFAAGSIHHLIEPDVNQEIYGVPQYLAGLQSAWLNEAATLFRRKYYKNGSHAGFILYINDAAQNEDDITAMRDALKGAKGPGNFRNLFLYSPNGKKDGIQLIPISEVQAKDEFFNIKNVTRDDVLAAHRVPPQLMGMVPSNVGGFGDVEKAAAVFVRNELVPLQSRLKEVNDWLGLEVVRFDPYIIPQQPTS